MKRKKLILLVVFVLIAVLCMETSKESIPNALAANRIIIPGFDYGINMQTAVNDFAGVVTVNEIKHPTGMYDYEYTDVLAAYCTVEEVLFGEYADETIELKIYGYEPYEEGETYLVFAEKLPDSMAGQFYHTIEDGIYKINIFGRLEPYSKIGKAAVEKLNTARKMREYLSDKQPGYRDENMYTALS